MTIMITKQQLQHVAIAMISMAKAELEEHEFSKLPIPAVQEFVLLIAESIPVNHLTDSTLLRHAVHQLVAGNSVQEVVMHVFTLSIFRMTSEGSNHPLERGIIKQKIIGILPIFENAVNRGFINTELYDRNADALAHIADSSEEVPDILAALSAEYLRLKR